jgi:hypothetical protein
MLNKDKRRHPRFALTETRITIHACRCVHSPPERCGSPVCLPTNHFMLASHRRLESPGVPAIAKYVPAVKRASIEVETRSRTSGNHSAVGRTLPFLAEHRLAGGILWCQQCVKARHLTGMRLQTGQLMLYGRRTVAAVRTVIVGSVTSCTLVPVPLARARPKQASDWLRRVPVRHSTAASQPV